VFWHGQGVPNTTALNWAAYRLTAELRLEAGFRVEKSLKWRFETWMEILAVFSVKETNCENDERERAASLISASAFHIRQQSDVGTSNEG
jgi:hypothetical protein